MNSTFRVLDALAASVHLDPGGELARFEAEGRRVLGTEPTWRSLVLHALDGRILIHTGRASTGEGFVIDRVSFDAVWPRAARRWGGSTPSRGRHGLPAARPGGAGRELRYVLSAILSPEAMGALLARDPRHRGVHPEPRRRAEHHRGPHPRRRALRGPAGVAGLPGEGVLGPSGRGGALPVGDPRPGLGLHGRPPLAPSRGG